MAKMNISVLKGQAIENVAVINDNAGKDEIVFTTGDGNVYRLYHEQGCCESVYIEDIAGDLADLIGSPILNAEEVTHDNENPKEITVIPNDQADDMSGYDSFTWTFYKLSTIKGSVTIRWYGVSTGYYSESVDFEQTEPRLN